MHFWYRSYNTSTPKYALISSYIRIYLAKKVKRRIKLFWKKWLNHLGNEKKDWFEKCIRTPIKVTHKTTHPENKNTMNAENFPERFPLFLFSILLCNALFSPHNDLSLVMVAFGNSNVHLSWNSLPFRCLLQQIDKYIEMYWIF